jgi:cob(I)alamin adenosyltransferase
MIRTMVRIYTRGGDDGSTGLYGGSRVSKADPRVDAYGCVDELNAVLGWVQAAAPPAPIGSVLDGAQHGCFRLGAWLACAPGKEPGIDAIGDEEIQAFESAIDELEARLAPLKTFILPGGSEAGARLHVARTVCRRAERRLVELAQTEHLDPAGIRWLNRLSDLLFVQARFANHEGGQPETPWLPAKA